MTLDTITFNSTGWSFKSQGIESAQNAQIVFTFGDSDTVREASYFESLRRRYPSAHIVGASSSGNIAGAELIPCAAVATAVAFDRGRVEVGHIDFEPGANVKSLARDLIAKLPRESLRHIFLISDGLSVNGSELIEGVNLAAPGVSVTGGLAGDGDRFESTWVLCDDLARERRIVAVGFYGESLKIGTGCFAGWTEFGTDRVITRSKDNVLYEIDGEPALDLYKRYLGEYAKDLPNSGLRFPLSIKKEPGDPEVVRTLLGIDEAERAILFAGNVPEGYMARLMKPDIDVLIDAAAVAAREIEPANDKPALGLVVSCVGRKIVMDQLIDEELEAVGEVLGDAVELVGFYSYGEIAPFAGDRLHCELHNQTMTLTAVYEV